MPFLRLKKTPANTVVKKVIKRTGRFIKKRYTKSGKLNINKIVRDVSMVKRMLNAEKKTISINIQNQVFGQLLGNSAGYHSNDITPVPIQGSGIGQRNGQSIKICSWHMTAQIIQQSDANQRINYKMYMYKISGDPEPSPATFVTEQWATNNFVGGGGQIVDYNSMINPNRFAEAKLVYFKAFSIAPDSITGQTGFKTINIGGKFQHHIRYDGNNNTVTQGQLILVILADGGNCSPTTVSTFINTPNTAINTGCKINYQLQWYFYDN